MKRIADVLLGAIPVLLLGIMLLHWTPPTDRSIAWVLAGVAAAIAVRFHFLDRELTHLRERVYALEKKVDPTQQTLETRARQLLAHGKEIDAVRLYRTETGAGLRDALSAVSRLR